MLHLGLVLGFRGGPSATLQLAIRPTEQCVQSDRSSTNGSNDTDHQLQDKTNGTLASTAIAGDTESLDSQEEQ